MNIFKNFITNIVKTDLLLEVKLRDELEFRGRQIDLRRDLKEIWLLPLGDLLRTPDQLQMSPPEK